MHFVNTQRINKVVIYFKSSSISVSLGFGGLTGDIPTVRPAQGGGQTGDGDSKQRLITAVRPIDLHPSDRVIYTGQTGGIHSVKLADQSRSDQLPSNSRVTFTSAKSFRFLGIPTIHPPFGSLSSCDSILQTDEWPSCQFSGKGVQVKSKHIYYICAFKMVQ